MSHQIAGKTMVHKPTPCCPKTIQENNKTIVAK